MRLGIDAVEAAEARVLASFPPEGCDWARCFTARFERANFASRYHVVYPAIALFSVLRRRPERARELRAVLDVMYEGLVDERCWRYWHTELYERSGAIVERNLTYAGRLAVFVGLYLDAFGDTPSPTIDVDGDRVGYHELSARLAEQMATSPSCGVSCYHHESMVMCNAALMINNVVHDRLAGTRYADLNETWMRTVRDELVRPADAPTVFFYGTEPGGPAANPVKASLGMDAWALALLSAVAPTDVAAWYPAWRAKLRIDGDRAWVPVDERRETPAELASVEYATAWALVIAAELGDDVTFERLDRTLARTAITGFRVDPYLSGLYVLAHHIGPGGLRRLVAEPGPG
ncbi:MAG: hypothetical protein AAFZ07_11545 [Actinomycetota bacterium]